MLQQHQRGQAHDLRLGLEQPQQQPRQADGLVAQRRAVSAVRRGRIALVEDQDRSSRRPPRGARRARPRPASRTARRHRRPRALARVMRCSIAALADQEGARDLLDREPRHDAQRQRDLLRRRQVRMAADEQQPQDVVAIMRAVEPLGELAPRRRRDRRSRLRRAAAACFAPPPHARRSRRCGRP